MSFRSELCKRMVGRPPRFETPDELWHCFLDYVEMVDAYKIDLPMYMTKRNKKGKSDEASDEGKAGQVARPLTLQGFMCFAGMGQEWRQFADYTSKRSPEFSTVITRIRTTIENDQVSGALAKIYDSNLTARLNGLKDRTDHTSGDEPLEVKFKVVKP